MSVTIKFRTGDKIRTRVPNDVVTSVAQVVDLSVPPEQRSASSVVISVNANGTISSGLTLGAGSYLVTTKIGDGMQAAAHVDVKSGYGKNTNLLVPLTITGQPALTLGPGFDSFSVGSASAVGTVVFSSQESGTRTVLTIDAKGNLTGKVSNGFDVLVNADKGIADALSNPQKPLKDIASGYVGVVQGVRHRTASGHPKFDMPLEFVTSPAITRTGVTADFKPSSARRFLLETSATDGGHGQRLTARPDKEVKSGEAFKVFRAKVSGEERAVIRPLDPALDALLRYHRSGDLLEAQKIVDVNKERLSDVSRYPMFCLAAAYLMPFWNESDETTAASIPWLDELGGVLERLPDPAIIKAALYIRRKWTALPRLTALSDRARRHEMAAKLAVESLAQGVPAYRFGFFLLSEVLDTVAGGGNIEQKQGEVCQRGADMVAWLSRSVDPAQSCTSIDLW